MGGGGVASVLKEVRVVEEVLSEGVHVVDVSQGGRCVPAPS